MTSAPRQRPWHHWSKMAATVVQNAFCVLELAKTKVPRHVSEWLLPQTQQDGEHLIFIQDGAPHHWHNGVRHYLYENLPRRWIGWSADENMALTCWSPRSPDLTPCDFFLWGYVKDRVFVPSLPVSLNELKQCITTAVASVDEDTLRSVWTELDYRIDICRVTKGSHTQNICNFVI